MRDLDSAVEVFLARAPEATTLRTVISMRMLAGVSAVFLSSALSSSLWAQGFYTIVDLGTLGGTGSFAAALNNSGQVVGTSDSADQIPEAFFRDPASSMRSLGALGGADSAATAINAGGRVAGSARNADGEYRAFLSYGNGGRLIDLGTLGGNNSYAYGVNLWGQVAGHSVTANGTTHAFISGAHGAALRDLGTLGGSNSYATAINANGQVSGYSQLAGSSFSHAFISDPNGGALRDLGTLGGRFSFGLAMNDAGQVTGRSEIATFGQHAFLSAPNGGPLLDLGTLGGISSFGYGLNEAGAVAGYSFLADNSTAHAFLYTAEAGMVDLNTLLTGGSGWILREARDINDLGQIVGWGTIGNEARAFLLNPVGFESGDSALPGTTLVPEPGSYALLVLGAAVLALCRYRSGRFVPRR